MPNVITFTLAPQYAGLNFNPGPFNIYGNQGGSQYTIATNVPKSSLLVGVVYTVPDGITSGTIVSVGSCTNSVPWSATIPPITYEPITIYGRRFSITNYNGNFEGVHVRYRDMSDNVLTVPIMDITDKVIDPLDPLISTYSICVNQIGSYNTPVCVLEGIEVPCETQWVMVGICQ